MIQVYLFCYLPLECCSNNTLICEATAKIRETFCNEDNYFVGGTGENRLHGHQCTDFFLDWLKAKSNSREFEDNSTFDEKLLSIYPSVLTILPAHRLNKRPRVE